MKRVFKYQLKSLGRTIIKCQLGRVLHANVQRDNEHIWIETDDSFKEQTIEVEVFGTGQEFPTGPWNYVNTFFVDTYVWHVYTRIL